MATTPPFYCPRSCHEGRTYATLDEVKKHVAGQHPDHDPDWAEDPENAHNQDGTK